LPNPARIRQRAKVSGSKFKVKKMVMDETAAFEGLPRKNPPGNLGLKRKSPQKFPAGAPTGLTKFSPAHLIS
jgi:hypothetical protein